MADYILQGVQANGFDCGYQGDVIGGDVRKWQENCDRTNTDTSFTPNSNSACGFLGSMNAQLWLYMGGGVLILFLLIMAFKKK
jgi:hypothetical protein